jgi:hypothetical protein
MRFLDFRLRGAGGRGLLELRLCSLPDVGAQREVVDVLVVLEDLELDAQLELVRRSGVRKPDREA